MMGVNGDAVVGSCIDHTHPSDIGQPPEGLTIRHIVKRHALNREEILPENYTREIGDISELAATKLTAIRNIIDMWLFPNLLETPQAYIVIYEIVDFIECVTHDILTKYNYYKMTLFFIYLHPKYILFYFPFSKFVFLFYE